jgi:hypothetical protein
MFSRLTTFLIIYKVSFLPVKTIILMLIVVTVRVSIIAIKVSSASKVLVSLRLLLRFTVDLDREL